jgi:spore germination protein Q
MRKMMNAYDPNGYFNTAPYGYSQLQTRASGFSTGYPGQFGGGTSGAIPPAPSGAMVTPTGTTFTSPQMAEQSYVENILRLNLGKIATIYMTFENNVEWNAKVFRGKLEAAGRDHIIISDPATGKRYLLLTLNLDYITFDEQLNYFTPPGVPLPR